MQKPEYILCAAIHCETGIAEKGQCTDTGFVICGRRHSDCHIVLKMFCTYDYHKTSTDGFVTSKNRFVNRQQAFAIAMENNQVWHTMFKKGEFNEVGLTSEDLYYGDDFNKNPVIQPISSFTKSGVKNIDLEIF